MNSDCYIYRHIILNTQVKPDESIKCYLFQYDLRVEHLVLDKQLGAVSWEDSIPWLLVVLCRGLQLHEIAPCPWKSVSWYHPCSGLIRQPCWWNFIDVNFRTFQGSKNLTENSLFLTLTFPRVFHYDPWGTGDLLEMDQLGLGSVRSFDFCNSFDLLWFSIMVFPLSLARRDFAGEI